MLWVNVKRIIRTGFLNFGRNAFVSLSSVLVMVITLSVIASLIFVSATLNTLLVDIRSKVDINVYFLTSAQEPDILALQGTLETLPEIESVSYTSREQALENFRLRHENDESTLQALDELEDNPLGASLNIRAKDPSQYAGIAEFLEGDGALSTSGQEIIDKINYFQNKTMIDRLTRLINSAERLGTIVTIALVVVSILITFNTIRLAIYISREEISVMRLVGASSFYIRGPFVVAGTIYGALAGLLTLILFYPATYWMGSKYSALLGINLFEYYTRNFGQVFLIIMLSGMAIGAVSSFLAVLKYLKT
jgi:cell division transport system permease protein